MPWTTPRTWTTNETVTASHMNTHIRDNFVYLATEPCELWVKKEGANQAIAAATTTAVTYQTEKRRVSFATFTSGDTSFTIPETGIYCVSAITQWSGGGSGGGGIEIGGTVIVWHGGQLAASNHGNPKNPTITQRITSSTAVRCLVRTDTAQNLQETTDTQNGGTQLWIAQVQRTVS